MDKIVKLNSKQGSFDSLPNANSTKLFADFTVPGGAVYNMANSYINVNCRVSTTDTNTASNLPQNSGGNSIYQFDVGLTDDTLSVSDRVVPNVALVKNAFLKSQNLGKIDDIRRVDRLKTFLYSYEKDLNDQIDKSHYSMSGTREVPEVRNSPFVRLEREGTDNSVYEDHDIKIRMGEIFDICNEEQLDCNRLGDLEVHLELNLDKVVLNQSLGDADSCWAHTAPYPTGNTADNADFETHDYVAPSSGTTDSVTQLTTKRGYSIKDFKKQSPFHTGQKLAITGTAAGTAITNRERIITNIEYLKSGTNKGKLQLTFDAEIAGLSTPGSQLVITSAKGVDAAGATLSINSIELVLQEVANPQNVPSRYMYYAYDTEEDNHGNRQLVKKNYMINGDCANVYVTFGDGILPTLNTAVLSHYRISQDNVDLYDRNVEDEEPLHFDNVSRTYNNNGRELKSLQEQILDGDDDNSSNLNNVDGIMFPTLNKPDGSMSIIGLEIKTTNAGVNNLAIFQERRKEI